MMKLNVISASVLVLIGASASAGTLTTATPGGTVFAIENYRGTDTNATAAASITPGGISYSLSTITAVNPGATIYFTVRLNGGNFAAVPAIGTFSFAGAPLAAPAPGAVGGTVTRSTDQSTVRVEIVNGTAGTITLGLGAFNYTPAAGNIASVAGTLNTIGGVVTASVGLTTVAPSSIEASTPQTTVDGPLPTATIATAAKAIDGRVSPLAGYNGRIDLTASPAGSTFTTGGFVALGSVTFTNITGTQLIRSAASDFQLANGNAGANTGATVTITPGAGQAFPVGSVLSLHTVIGCTAAVAGTTGSGTTAFTGTTASTAKVLTTTTPVTTGTEWFVCLTAPSAGNTATPLTASITADVAESQPTTELIDNAVGTGYALTFNGSQVDVKNYFPVAVQTAFGYRSFVRVINTGTVAAAVSGAFIDEVTGVVGSSFALPRGALAVGAARTYTGAEIESVLGAPGAGDRPRIRLTAPTNAIVVQYFLQNPDGTIVELSSSQ